MTMRIDGYVPVAGSERRTAPGARLLGPAPEDEALQATIVLRRRPDGPPIRELFEQPVPHRPRTRLSEAEFAATYGAHPHDVDAITAFGRAHGLEIRDVSIPRRTVLVSGSVSQMQTAFAVSLGRYVIDASGEEYRGREGPVYVPDSLSELLIGVFGLDNRRIGGRNAVGDPPGNPPASLGDIVGFYDFPTTSAAGQTIAIVSYGGTQNGYDTSTSMTSDLGQFFGLNALPLPQVITVPPAAEPHNGTPDPETTQDICIAGGVAQDATIAVYFLDYFDPGNAETQQAWVGLLGRVVTPDTGDLPAGIANPSVISSSAYIANGDDSDGLAVSGATTAFVTAVHMVLEDAAAKFITVCAAAGDQGSDSKIGSAAGVEAWFPGRNIHPDHQAHVQYPGSDPLVLSCGGTVIGDVNGASFEEYVWNDTTTDPDAAVPNWATGGGVSAFFTETAGNMLSYQTAAGITPRSVNDNHVGRGIPDVAGNASLNTGYQIWVNGHGTKTNGTSAVAPLYAGLIAVLNRALGQNIGFLNPTLYALGRSVCRPVFGPPGPADNGLNGITGYPATSAWNACTGWGVLQGGALLGALEELFQKSLTFILDRSTFGRDEVIAAAGPDGSVFAQALFVVVQGLKPSDFPGTGGITTLSPSPSQLAAWAPTIPPPGSTNIQITATSVSSDDPDLGPEIQTFTFTYQVIFPDPSAFTGAVLPEVLPIKADLAAAGGLSAQAEIELVAGGDPYFSSESNGGLSWLSEDLRVFYDIEGATRFGAPPLVSTAADALSYINAIVSQLEGPTGTASGSSDTFEGLPTTEGDAVLSLNSMTTTTPSKAIFNFALARVRLNGTSDVANTVRVFFRLCQSQVTSAAFVAPAPGAGSSPPTGPYRQWSDGVDDGAKIPLLGISADGTEYVTVPCFASARVADMTAQTDPTNVKPTISPPAISSDTTYAYFGCWLDSNQPTVLFPASPLANPDGPFSDPTQTVGQLLARGNHQCLVAQIVYDEAPIPAGATPSTSDKLAQRNIAYTTVNNPGTASSRLATHTFEIVPSPGLGGGQLPDELMIDWGGLPAGSVAYIYLPAVTATDILALAARSDPRHILSVRDPHTISLPAGGTTYVPIPQGQGSNFAGLLTVDLPSGIVKAQRFDVVVRQVANRRSGEKGDRAVIRGRQVIGAFQVAISVSTKSVMLLGAERTLSVTRWINAAVPATSRWHLVLDRYRAQLAGVVDGLGGDAAIVPATLTGVWGTAGTEDRITGQVAGLVYDDSGDFIGFVIESAPGADRRFSARSPRLERRLHRAQHSGSTVTVVVRAANPDRPVEIIVN